MFQKSSTSALEIGVGMGYGGSPVGINNSVGLCFDTYTGLRYYDRTQLAFVSQSNDFMSAYVYTNGVVNQVAPGAAGRLLLNRPGGAVESEEFTRFYDDWRTPTLTDGVCAFLSCRRRAVLK